MAQAFGRAAKFLCKNFTSGGLSAPPNQFGKRQTGPPEDICEQMKPSAFDFCQVCHAGADGADAVQQVQAIAPRDLVFRVDLNRVKKPVDGGAQSGHRGHGGSEIFGFHRGCDDGFGVVKGREQAAFRVGFREFGVCPVGLFNAVFRLCLGQDGVRAFEPLDQVRAIGSFQKRGEGLGAVYQLGQVIVAGHGEAGVDDVVADVLVSEENFQAVVEEGEEAVIVCLCTFRHYLARLNVFWEQVVSS